jgi:hypothetical protein
MGLLVEGLTPLKFVHNFSWRLPKESIEPGGRLLMMSHAMIMKDFAMVYSSPPAAATVAS